MDTGLVLTILIAGILIGCFGKNLIYSLRRYLNECKMGNPLCRTKYRAEVRVPRRLHTSSSIRRHRQVRTGSRR